MKSAVVVGAGVSGLATARCLQRCGFDVTVVERKVRLPRRGEMDRGLGIWMFAQKALTTLGLEAPLEELGTRIPSAAYRTREGTFIAKGRTDHPDYYRRVLAIRQNDIVNVLADPNHNSDLPPLQFRFDSIVKGIENHQNMGRQGVDPVTLILDDGSKLKADVVVGADGIKSGFRRLLAPASRRGVMFYTGYRSVGGIIDDFDLSFNNGEQEHPYETLVGDHRFAVIPLGPKSVFWFASFKEPDDTFYANVRDLQEWKAFDESLHARLVDIYGGCHAPIKQLLDTVKERKLTMILDFHMEERDPMFSKERVGFVGDAAHAVAPWLAQGASLGIEDAWELSCSVAPLAEAAGPLDVPLNRLTHPGTPPPTSLAYRLSEYHTKRMDRLIMHNQVTKFCKRFTGGSPYWESLRNTLSAVVPDSLKAMVYENQMKESHAMPVYKLYDAPHHFMHPPATAAARAEEAQRKALAAREAEEKKKGKARIQSA